MESELNMNKEQLLKIVPCLIMGISIVFVLYATGVMQNVENQCNTHLAEQYKKFEDGSCTLCSSQKSNLNPLGIENVSIELPAWAR